MKLEPRPGLNDSPLPAPTWPTRSRPPRRGPEPLLLPDEEPPELLDPQAASSVGLPRAPNVVRPILPAVAATYCRPPAA